MPPICIQNRNPLPCIRLVLRSYTINRKSPRWRQELRRGLMPHLCVKGRCSMAIIYRFSSREAISKEARPTTPYVPPWEQYSPVRRVILPDFFYPDVEVVRRQDSGCKLDYKGFYFRLIVCKKPGESIRAFCKRTGYSKSAFYHLRQNPSSVASNRRVNPKLADNLGVDPGWLELGLDFGPLRERGKWPHVELAQTAVPSKVRSLQ